MMPLSPLVNTKSRVTAISPLKYTTVTRPQAIMHSSPILRSNPVIIQTMQNVFVTKNQDKSPREDNINYKVQINQLQQELDEQVKKYYKLNNDQSYIKELEGQINQLERQLDFWILKYKELETNAPSSKQYDEKIKILEDYIQDFQQVDIQQLLDLQQKNEVLERSIKLLRDEKSIISPIEVQSRGKKPKELDNLIFKPLSVINQHQDSLYEEKISKLEQIIYGLNVEQQTYRSQISQQSQDQIENLQKIINKQNQQIKQFTIRENDYNVKKFENRLSQFQIQQQDMNPLIKEQEAKIRLLEEEVENYKSSNQDEQQNSQEEKIAQMEMFLSNLQTNLMNQHKNQIQGYEDKITSLNHQISKFSSQLQSKAQEFDSSLLEYTKDMEASFQDQKQAYDKKVASLEQSIISLNQAPKQDEKIKQLELMIKNLQNQQSNKILQESDHQYQKSQYSTLEKYVQELELSFKNQSINSSRQYEEKLKNQEVEINELKSQLQSKVQNQESQLLQYIKELQDVEQDLLHTKNQQSNQLQHQSTIFDELKSQIDELQNELAIKNNQQAVPKNEICQIIEKQQQTLDQKMKSLDNEQNEYNFEQMKSQIIFLEEELDKYRNQIQSIQQQQIETNKTRDVKFQDQYEELQEWISKYKQIQYQLQHQNSDQDRGRSSQKKELEQWRKERAAQTQSSRKSPMQNDNDYEHLMSEHNELKNLYHLITQDSDKFQFANQRLLDQLDILRMKNMTLEQKLAALIMVEQRNFILSEEVDRLISNQDCHNHNDQGNLMKKKEVEFLMQITMAKAEIESLRRLLDFAEIELYDKRKKNSSHRQ